MVKAARKIDSALPQYSRTFEGYCNALINGLLNPDEYTMAWVKTIENQLATGELTWTPAKTPQEKALYLAAVKRVGRAIAFKREQEEAAEKQSRSLMMVRPLL